jgi:hypothetical protein
MKDDIPHSAKSENPTFPQTHTTDQAIKEGTSADG